MLYPGLKSEINAMAAKRARRELTWGNVLDTAFEESSAKQLLEDGIVKRVIDKVGMDEWWTQLTPEQKQQLAAKLTQTERPAVDA
jgi:hypothetical protein